MEAKKCIVCGQEKPRTREFWPAHNRMADGMTNKCKLCTNAYLRQFAQRPEQKIKNQERLRRRREELWPRELARLKRWQKANPDKVRVYARRHNLKKNYGITLEDYDAMLAEQGGVCALCRKDRKGEGDTGRHAEYGGRHMAIDHNHVTGKIRGILCHRCNRMLGHVKEDVEVFRRAIEYLEKHKEAANA